MNDDTPRNDDPSPQPEASPTPVAATNSPTRTTPSPTVLTIAFIIIALLGVVIFQGIIPKKESATAESPAFESLKADIESRRTMLNRERIALGLDPLGGTTGIESAEEVAARLKSDADTLASLANSFQDLLSRKELLLGESRSETVAALKEQKRLREMLEAANSELRQAMIDSSLVSTLKADLERTTNQLIALQSEIDRLKQEPEMLRQQLLECTAARQDLERQLAAIQSELQQASLFAGTEAEILQGAIELFRALRQLEGRPDSEVMSAYSQLGQQLGAQVLKRCDFATGSSDVAPELESGLLALADEIPSNALIFVVGYASVTGNVDSNRALSSDRATSVARILDNTKKPTQQVQAAYLGQTRRFSGSTPEQNQIVEIWQIVPQTQ